MAEVQQSDLHPFEHEQRQRATLVAILRIVFIGAFIVVTVLAILGGESAAGRGIPLVTGWHIVLGFAVLLGLVVGLVDYFTPNKKLSTIASVFFGLLVAMLATFVAGQFIDLLANLYDIALPQLISTIKVLVGIALAYLGIVSVLQTKDDFRLVIPYVEFSKQLRGPRPLVLDTSALIDARVVDLAQSEIIQAPIVVPEFVVAELQSLADSRDRTKRDRGRRGLDVIARLQRSAVVDVSIDETSVQAKAVDQMLIELASAMPAIVVTTDLGLTRVARIQGVKVLNLNDLAQAMRPSLVQGERLELRLVKPGEHEGQGVGYLEDGTMVVAEDGHPFIGRTVTLTITNMVQTSAGRLIFGRVGGPEGGEAPAARGGSSPADQAADRPAPHGPRDAPARVAETPEAIAPAATIAAEERADKVSESDGPGEGAGEADLAARATTQPRARGPHPPRDPRPTARGRNPRR